MTRLTKTFLKCGLGCLFLFLTACLIVLLLDGHFTFDPANAFIVFGLGGFIGLIEYRVLLIRQQQQDRYNPADPGNLAD